MAARYNITPGSLHVIQGEHFAIEVQGNVYGFLRPFSKHFRNRVWVVNPAQRRQDAMKNAIAAALLERANDAGENEASLVFPPRVALLLRATFFYHRPNSHFITGRTRHVTNLRPGSTDIDMINPPDLDNMVKFIMDRPLEGVVYGNDRTIVKIVIEKLWDDRDECTGRTDITVDLRHRV
eukprot:scaffold3798_cov256-Chaetoceros_neogracile.AAC.4